MPLSRYQFLIQVLLLTAACLVLVGCGDSEPAPEIQAEHADYKGWIIVWRGLKQGRSIPASITDAQLDDESLWYMQRDLSWSSAGTRIPVMVDDYDTGYEVELIEVVYGKTVPVLKVAVYQDGNERALAYSWAASGSKRVGINLRWLQSGLTRQ